jgi:hypothetical protein
MRRVAIGLIIVLHGIAHAAAGMWSSGRTFAWYMTALWGAAMIGYLVAGFGVLRTPGLRRIWKGAFVVATFASFLLLNQFGHPALVPGMLVDLTLLIVVLIEMSAIDTAIGVAGNLGWRRLSHPVMHALGWSVSLAFVAYAAAVVVMRPTAMTWGTTAELRKASLPGDDLVPDPRYRIDHSIVIRAPSRLVWPWLMQIGQDRAGFYSYAWLERAFGARITNADEIHAEWQNRSEGDFVRAVQPNYLGGVFGSEVGWRITRLVPGQLMVLENWGAFIVQPIDSVNTRLTVRTRGEGIPSLGSVFLSPVNVFLFEPAHFIMERQMLRGIRTRAERQYVRMLEKAKCDDAVFQRC